MTTCLPNAVYEQLESVLEVRNIVDDVLVSTGHMVGPDAIIMHEAALDLMRTIDTALDLMNYDTEWV